MMIDRRGRRTRAVERVARGFWSQSLSLPIRIAAFARDYRAYRGAAMVVRPPSAH
eukprot:COSAG04_NODE_23618_length_335_cov_0.877119_1_plen_54_part_01